MRLLKEEGRTLIVIEHRLSYLMDIADRFVYVENGKLAYEFSPQDVQQLPEERRLGLGLRSPVSVSLPGAEFSAPANDSKKSLFELRRIGKKIKKTKILNDVNMQFFQGEVCALTGKNGTGKSTSMMIAAGLMNESEGEVLFEGRKLRTKERSRSVWYSSNDTNTQFFCDSVESELLLMAQHDEETLERARRLLRDLGLYQVKDRHPATLSGGQRLRLSCACGMLSNRSFLVFDEPTSGLDGGSLLLVARLFSDMAKNGKAVVLITHDGELVRACCHRVVQLT